MAGTSIGMKRFYLVLAGAAVLGLGVLVYLMLKPTSANIPADVTVAPADTAGFHGYLLGSASAPVEVTEYGDYQCPACAQFEVVQFPDVRQRLIETGRVRWRYRDFPLQQHQHARVAAHAAACADEQGKYWDMHRLLYEGQGEWAEKGDAAAIFRSYARSAGLDVEKYDACMKSAKYAGRIQASLQEGIKAGVNSTPTIVVAGKRYPGIVPYDVLRKVVDSLAARPAQ